MHMDIARANAQRRDTGEALQAEHHAPEQLYTCARPAARPRSGIAGGRRAPEELVELAKRSAAMP